MNEFNPEPDNDELDTSTWPKTKQAVIDAFMAYLTEMGKSMGIAMSTGRLSGGGSGGSLLGLRRNSDAAVVGSMAVLLGTIIGVELATRDSEIAARLIKTMTSTANERPDVTALGGFELVVDKTNKELTTLIKAYDLAE